MSYDPEHVQSAFVSMAQYVFDRLPDDVQRAEITAGAPYHAFGGSSSGYTDSGDEIPVLYDDPFTNIASLRDVMYEPGTGTWYRAKFTVTRAGEAEAEYDYDGEPENTDIIDPTEWVFELRKYPRDAEHIPDWLRMNLDISYQAFPQLLAEDIAANRPWLTDADRRR